MSDASFVASSTADPPVESAVSSRFCRRFLAGAPDLWRAGRQCRQPGSRAARPQRSCLSYTAGPRRAHDFARRRRHPPDRPGPQAGRRAPPRHDRRRRRGVEAGARPGLGVPARAPRPPHRRTQRLRLSPPRQPRCADGRRLRRRGHPRRSTAKARSRQPKRLRARSRWPCTSAPTTSFAAPTTRFTPGAPRAAAPSPARRGRSTETGPTIRRSSRRRSAICSSARAAQMTALQ